MKNTAKRIGLTLATVHTGSSLKLWTELAGEAESSGNPFFVFSGGRLNSRRDSEYLRNGVYALANKENLDGLISWSSSIGGFVSIEEIIQFHHRLEPLPFVTIGQKIDGHAFANFDAYTGMKNLTLHFIREHGAERLAFIRGPENHMSAAERFTGFCDAVTESGLTLDDTLITSPFPWGMGESAAAQLFAERRLIPGKDFDTLIGSSDMLVFAAVRYFERQGFSVPQHFRTGGFNDSAESLIASCPFSTVHMPYTDLARTAYRMITSVLENPAAPISDEKIEAPVIIRESCGCNRSEPFIFRADAPDMQGHEADMQEPAPEARCYAPKGPEHASYSVQTLASRICALITSSHPILPGLIEKAVAAFSQKARVQCEALLDQILFYYLKSDGDLSVLPAIGDLIRRAKLVPESYFMEMHEYMLFSIPKIQNRIFSAKKYESMQLIDILNRLKCELLRAHSRKELLSILKELLPQIGVHTMSIVLYEDDDLSSYMGGFAPDGRPESWTGSGYCRTVSQLHESPDVFPSQLLFPPDIGRYYKEGCFMVQPLFIENQPIGYLLTNIAFYDGGVYEDLRAAISSALQGIFLFEQTAKARQIAESAEFAKTEFFANVGSGLCDPLNEIEDKLDQIGLTLAAHPEATDIIGEQLLFIKAQVAAQLREMSVLVDLTRSQVNDLPMDKTLVYVPDILPEDVKPATDVPYPLIFGDREQIEKALRVIAEKSAAPVQICAEASGLSLRFTYADDSVFGDWSYPVYLLAEKIIALHFGRVIKSGAACTVVFPYPNLAGLPPLKMHESPECVCTVSDFTAAPRVLPDLSAYPFDSEVVPGAEEVRPFLFALLPDATPMQNWVRLYSLRNDANVFRAPVACYGKEFAGKSFMEVLESKIRTEKIEPILFIGTAKTRYPLWATDVNSISIGSINELDRILAEITPALIVFENAEEADIKRIRQISKTVLTPIAVLPDSIESEETVKMLCAYPKIILCNQGAAESEQFAKRVHDILAGIEILPPHTGALVKNAILYLNRHAASQIVRWKLADAVCVSEDYLTRIFHKEIGLSLWEYLNRYRIHLATKMLLETNATIYEIAEKTGFQDQAYFCRVFKKIYGIPPGKIRTKQ